MKNILLLLALLAGASAYADSTLTIPLGSPAKIEVKASGTQPFTYEWYKDNVRLPNETGAAIVIPSLTAAHAGAYRAIVMNPKGQTSSDRGTVVVGPPAVVAPSGATITITITVTPAP